MLVGSPSSVPVPQAIASEFWEIVCVSSERGRIEVDTSRASGKRTRLRQSQSGEGGGPVSARPNRGHGQQVAVATVYVVAVFINLIDATVVNVALPTIAGAFAVPVGQTATVNLGFLVALAVTVPAAGWLGDRFGTREVFVIAVGLFTAASAACGFAGSLGQLVAFRVAQGLAGGLMMPVGMAMMYHTFLPAERIRVSRIINVPIAFAPAAGPLLGGFLVEHAGWRWIFWINLPIGVVAVTMTLLTVHSLTRPEPTRPDIAGFALFGGGFASLMYALSEGASQGWLTGGIAIPGLAGIALLVAAVAVELRVTTPMLQLRLFAVRLFRSANLITVCSSASFIAALFVFPLMMQSALGSSPMEAGLLTFPEAAGVLVGTQIVGRMYARVGPRRLLAAGQLAVTMVLVLLALVTTRQTPPIVPVALMIALGIGQAFSFLPIQAGGFDTVPPRRTGEASALYSATRQAGSALGVAVAATVITAVGADAASTTAEWPFRWALLACAAWSLVGCVIAALAIDDADAAPSRGLVPVGSPTAHPTSR